MSSSGLADDSATKSAAKSNIYVQPGATRLTEPLLPPKGSAATSHKPTVLPSAPCRRDQYSDYRNDYYIKQEQKKSDDDKEKDKSVTACETASTELLTQNTELSEEMNDCNLKTIKNTPPLPRKKKRHRPGVSLNLCCFNTDQDRRSDEAV